MAGVRRKGKVSDDAPDPAGSTGRTDERAAQKLISVMQHNAELWGVKRSGRLLYHQQMLICWTGKMRATSSYLQPKWHLVSMGL